MGKHWRFCGTSWMNMKVIHEPDCYGKDNSRKFIRTWMGQGTNLGMYVCSSKTRVISVSFRGWHLNGWREAEYGSHVAEIDAKCWHWRTRIISWPCTFGMCSADANQMKHLLNSTRRCWITHFCWGNWKFTRAGKTSRKNCSVVLWHGRTGSKMRWVVLWTGKKLEQLYKDSSPSLLGCKHHTYLYARRRTFVSCAPHSARLMQPNPTPKHRIWAQLLQLPERRATPINLRDSFPCRDDATIISAAEDPEVPHSGGSRSSKETAVSRLPPCWDR